MNEMRLKHKCLVIVLFATIWFPLTGQASEIVVDHDLTVRLLPDENRMEVVDRLRLPKTLPANAVLRLNAGFTLAAGHGLQAAGVKRDLAAYRLPPDAAGKTLALRYSGAPLGIDAPTRLGDMPRGLIDTDGVFLDGASGWFPWLPGSLQTFRLHVDAPDGWRVVSQGGLSRDAKAFVWREKHPQDDIYLLADRYAFYRRPGGVAMQVYLLNADAPLARRYLDTSAHYVDFYSKLLGDYPYAKFAVVENRWQTGYGMPSFTLLGSRVMRLPFILHSSLPHEILHNWWGNGVYVDYREGNWSEGLTAYLSDYLLRERKARGAAYRRGALERFTNFAADGRDIPLARFISRHSESSQAVGYSKSLMLFHQIRRRLGDPAFFSALRHFYAKWKFRFATFGDLIAAFEQAGGESLADLVKPLLHGTGAPRLVLDETRLEKVDGGYRLNVRVRQKQAGPVYPLRVPVRIVFADGDSETRQIELDGRTAEALFRFERRPVSLAVDPEFQLFRLLDATEKPASLGRLFGAPRQLLILPSAASGDLPAWRRLAKQWQDRYHNIELVSDKAIRDLPEDAAVWILGWDNRFLAEAKRRAGVGDADADRRERVALVRLDADNRHAPLGFIGAQGAESIGLLARKLPHYSSYGELAFDLPGVRNREKRRLPVTHSALMRELGACRIMGDRSEEVGE